MSVLIPNLLIKAGLTSQLAGPDEMLKMLDTSGGNSLLANWKMSDLLIAAVITA